MAKHWAFVNDVNLWFAACIPGGNIPADILADAGNFSLVPYGDQSGVKEWDYYAELVRDRIFSQKVVLIGRPAVQSLQPAF